MNTGYEVDYDRKQSAQLWKFTAVNVRIINELKVSLCVLHDVLTWKDWTKSCIAALKFKTISALQRMHVIAGWKSAYVNTLRIMYCAIKAHLQVVLVEEIFQLCICPIQGTNHTVGRRWIMDVVVMNALKCGEREFFLNQVKCLNWPSFVYGLASSLGFSHSKHNFCLLS